MRKRLAVAIGIGVALAAAGQVNAAPAPGRSPSGITISPAYQQVQILADQSERELDLRITNNQTSAVKLQLSSQDFNALSDSGGLFFVGTNPTALQKKYGLAKWLSLPQSKVTVTPKQTVTVKAQIVNQSDLAPGGHYGAIMVSIDDSQQGNKQSNNISVQPIASSLLFVTKVGGDTHKLSLNKVEASHNLFRLPNQVTLRFYNDGNSHVVPRGVVSVTDAKGKLVSRGIINEESGILLPQNYRLYTVPLQRLALPIHTGHYKLTVDFRFDGYDQYRRYQESLLLITPVLVPILLVLLVAGGWAAYVLWYKPKK